MNVRKASMFVLSIFFILVLTFGFTTQQTFARDPSVTKFSNTNIKSSLPSSPMRLEKTATGFVLHFGKNRSLIFTKIDTRHWKIIDDSNKVHFAEIGTNNNVFIDGNLVLSNFIFRKSSERSCVKTQSWSTTFRKLKTEEGFVSAFTMALIIGPFSLSEPLLATLLEDFSTMSDLDSARETAKYQDTYLVVDSSYCDYDGTSTRTISMYKDPQHTINSH